MPGCGGAAGGVPYIQVLCQEACDSGFSIGVHRWTKPSMNCIKYNCDAAIALNGGSGIAFIARDNVGNFVGAGRKRILHTENVELVERRRCCGL